jgi:hypothetical protein
MNEKAPVIRTPATSAPVKNAPPKLRKSTLPETEARLVSADLVKTRTAKKTT